jgi:hypothetical protein
MVAADAVNVLSQLSLTIITSSTLELTKIERTVNEKSMLRTQRVAVQPSTAEMSMPEPRMSWPVCKGSNMAFPLTPPVTTVTPPWSDASKLSVPSFGTLMLPTGT